jgi:hypothetical protein
VNADYPAAGWALPSLLFTFQELVHAVGLDVLEVLDHAYAVFLFVTAIKGFQHSAWKIWAFKTVSDLVSCQFVAFLFDERTQPSP